MNLSDIKNHALKVRDFVLDLIFPIECVYCGCENYWLCPECLTKLEYGRNQYCLECKTVNNLGNFCQNCQDKYFIDGVLIAGNYDNPLFNKLIKNMKYYFVKDIAVILGNYLSKFLQNKIQERSFLNNIFNKQDSDIFNKQDILIIPVPLYSRRLRWRGFNQAEEMAKIVAKNSNYEIDNNSLVRTKNKKAQAKLDEKQRRKNIENCFSWNGENLKNKNIILLDDVVTTGATLNECAKILKQNGAHRVWGLVVVKG